MPTAAVIVIGDVGRSPRTANHALSLAEEKGYDVCLIGYAESRLNERILGHERITVLGLPPPPPLPLPELACLIWRFGWTAIVLMCTLLFRVGWSLDLVLVQNPPALPALIVAWMVCRLRAARFVIDWHNYTWSMLSQRWGLGEEELGMEWVQDSEEVKREKLRTRVMGGKASYIRLTHWLEGAAGRAADAALCVSKTMASDLAARWGVQATVFYDRPPQWKFGSVSLDDKHSLFCRLAEKAAAEGDERTVQAIDGGGEGAEEDTFFSVRDETTGEVRLREERPMIVVSSTSWTPDEDFSILLEAVVKYEKRAVEKESSLPPLFLLITGKGPEKEHYMREIEKLSLSRVRILSPWLEAADYPVAVAAADVGVCLHTSTSGVDLPMKVVDMFGCGVPVLAKRFRAIEELMEEGRNGHLFDTSDDLATQLIEMARGHPGGNQKLHSLQARVRSPEGRLRSWEELWAETAPEVFASRATSG